MKSPPTKWWQNSGLFPAQVFTIRAFYLWLWPWSWYTATAKRTPLLTHQPAFNSDYPQVKEYLYEAGVPRIPQVSQPF